MNIKIKNAVIEKATIAINEYGFLDAWIQLNYGGTVQCFGGFSLYFPESFVCHNMLSVAGHHFFRIMEIAGAEDWDKLKGKTIRVKREGSMIQSIGHIINDDWYCPSEDFKKTAGEK